MTHAKLNREKQSDGHKKVKAIKTGGPDPVGVQESASDLLGDVSSWGVTSLGDWESAWEKISCEEP